MTTSPSEWAAFLSLGTSFWAACAALLYLLHDAEVRDFDPRPVVRRAHQGLVHAGHDCNRAFAAGQAVARHAAREAALTAAVLLLLLTPRPEATR